MGAHLAMRLAIGVSAGVLAIGGAALIASTHWARAEETPPAAARVAAETEPRVFSGRVEAYRRADVSSQIDGVVREVRFAAGQRVRKGDPLFLLDDDRLKLGLAIAEGERDRAAARMRLAEQASARAADLAARGVSAEAELQAADAALGVAKAELAIAEAQLARAQLDLERAIIRAPISGRISAAGPTVGSFVEAGSDETLATVIQIDPVIVAYDVPYAARLDALRRSGAPSLEALLAASEAVLVLPDGALYPHAGQPRSASATIDPDSGALTTWALTPNPDGLLRPGMRVEVRVRDLEAGAAARD